MRIRQLLICALLLTICQWTMANVNAQALLASEKNTIQVFKAAAPYVVNVHNLHAMMNHSYDAFELKHDTGSGIIWNNRGYIVTNYHVIHGARKIAVTVAKGKTSEVQIVGAAPRQDIAVLKINNPKLIQAMQHLSSLSIADSSTLQVGQKTVAIGNPYGFGRTLTTGIISALDRQIPGPAGVSLRRLIQTDASINPGNSGGPLLDSRGQLIGMNTAIFSRSGSSAGIGFAVPSNDLKRIVSQIIFHGKYRQPGIGVQLLSDQFSAQLGIKGSIIAKVMPNTPAARAGLKGTSRNKHGRIIIGDIIIGIDGDKINNFDDLHNALIQKKIGQRIMIDILRNGKLYKIKLKTYDVQ